MTSALRPGAATEIADECVKRGALQKRNELASLLDMVGVNMMGRRPVIVEIGSDAGGTLYGWCQLSDRVYSISLHGGAFGSGAPLQSHGAVCLDADSHLESSQAWLKDRILGPTDPGWDGCIDVLFLDGDHTLEGVARDWNMYSPLVRPGGIVAFHDICWHGPHHPCQVDRFWAAVLTWPSVHTQTFIDFPTNWGGIGVVWKQA